MLLIFCGLAAGPASGAKEDQPPDGVKVAGSAQLDIYVERKESKHAAGYVLNLFNATIVVHHTARHGRQLLRQRREAVDADLLDPSMWQVGDFDGDGLDDFRVVIAISKQGCRTWSTEIWTADRDRFTASANIAYLTDASGQQVKSCH